METKFDRMQKFAQATSNIAYGSASEKEKNEKIETLADLTNYFLESRAYEPSKDGSVTAIHLWLKDQYQPMATLAFAFGCTATIEWDNITQRDHFITGINAYTIIYDDRTEWRAFETWLKEKS